MNLNVPRVVISKQHGKPLCHWRREKWVRADLNRRKTDRSLRSRLRLPGFKSGDHSSDAEDASDTASWSLAVGVGRSGFGRI